MFDSTSTTTPGTVLPIDRIRAAHINLTSALFDDPADLGATVLKAILLLDVAISELEAGTPAAVA